jgi:hypothetical protein
MFGGAEIDWTARHTLGVRCCKCDREFTIKVNRVFVEAHRGEKLPFICLDCFKLRSQAPAEKN